MTSTWRTTPPLLSPHRRSSPPCLLSEPTERGAVELVQRARSVPRNSTRSRRACSAMTIYVAYAPGDLVHEQGRRVQRDHGGEKLPLCAHLAWSLSDVGRSSC